MYRGVMFTSETLCRECRCLTPSVTLGDIALLYLLSVTLHCDICCTTLLMLISIYPSGDQFAQVCQCRRVICYFTGVSKLCLYCIE